MEKVIEVAFREVQDIVRRAFPGAKSRRTVKIRAARSHRVADYWDGGSRDYSVFLELGTLRTMSSDAIPREVRQEASNPFNLPIADVILTPGFCVVEHTIFCGKDLGYRIYVSHERFDTLMNCSNVRNEFTSPSPVVQALPAPTE